MTYRRRLLDLADKVAKSRVSNTGHTVETRYNALLTKVLAMLEAGAEAGYTEDGLFPD